MNLTASEICEIINCCKNSPVSEIDMSEGKLRIVFFSNPIESTSTTLKPNEVAVSSSGEANFTFEEDSKEMDLQELVEELQIADPAKYEELVGLGELVDGEAKDDR